MKTVIFSFLLILMSLVSFSQTTFTVTVSGTVTDEDSGVPVANQSMEIWTTDSVGMPYQNVVLTDSLGYYEDSFPSLWNGSVNVSTNSCNGYLTETGYFTPSNPNVVLDFSICTDAGGGDDCQAAFWYYYDSTDMLTLHFMDVSTGNPTSWQWDFGDGGTSGDQNPVHSYNQQGEYSVSLTIASDSCSSTLDVLIFVGDSIPNGDCEAMFLAYPQDGDSIHFLTMQFMDMSVGSNGAPPDSWLWNFGDGTYSAEQNPIHTYARGGTYTVCLTISDSAASCEDTYCTEVEVFGENNGCVASYYYYPTDSAGNGGVSYQFIDESEGQPDAWSWDFGDGTYSSHQNPTHLFPDNGLYEVCLTISNIADSCHDTYCEDILVGDSASFSLSGYVYLEDTTMADAATVYLMTFDTVSNGLVSIDQTHIQNDIGYYEFTGVGLQNCIYFVQAELNTNSAYYGNYVPTYHLDAVNWEDAWPILPFHSGNTYNIVMQPSVITPSGNGTINGVVNGQETRGLLSNIEVLLLNENKSPLEYSRTDNDGNFTFNNLGYSNYYVYTEIVGINTTPGFVSLSESNPEADVTVVVANGEAVMGLEENSAFIQGVSGIYPNPAGNQATLDVSVKSNSTVNIEVVNYYGQIVQNNSYKLTTGTNRLSLDFSTLPAGIYIVKVIPEDRITIQRKFVKTR